MGIEGAKKTRRETPETLIAYAHTLDRLSERLKKLAGRMTATPCWELTVLFSPGAHAAIKKTLEPFVLDAERKARAEGVILVD